MSKVDAVIAALQAVLKDAESSKFPLSMEDEGCKQMDQPASGREVAMVAPQTTRRLGAVG